MSNASWVRASASLCVVVLQAASPGCDTTDDERTASTTEALKTAPAAKTAPLTLGCRTTVTVHVPPASAPVTYEPWAIELDVKETPIAAY